MISKSPAKMGEPRRLKPFEQIGRLWMKGTWKSLESMALAAVLGAAARLFPLA